MGPSRVTATSSTLIDHIISGLQIPVLRSIQVCGLSDHRVQIVNLDYSLNKFTPKVQYVRPFQKCHWEELKLYWSLCLGVLCIHLVISMTSGLFFILFW